LDRGLEMYYYNTAERIAFVGYKNDEASLMLACCVNVANNVVTVNNWGNANVGNVVATGYGNFTGNVNALHLTSPGNVEVTGNVSGGNIITAGAVTGNGRALTSLDASNLDTGTVPSGRLSGTYTITVSGAATTAGTVTTAAQPNITSVGTLTSLSVTGNVSGGNLITAGLVSLSSIVKTGSNGVGNIGSASNQFNTVFAKATSAQYADLAEMYEADEIYEPGTVVSFGGIKEITISLISNDSKVAGVVSSDPAYLMNATQTGTAVPVALMGRVHTRVSGSVRKGDLMVSAGDGSAQASAAPQIGTVIGKSLEDFDGDQGMIEIVVGRL